jgi:CheY-like chemotaxis protein
MSCKTILKVAEAGANHKGREALGPGPDDGASAAGRIASLSDMLRILVIDDEAGVRKVLVRMLTSAGHEVTAAPDGAEGLRVWREAGTDLVITDVHMPELDGVQVIRELRAKAPALPVIAMSGSGNSRDLDRLRAAELMGAVGVLGKPFSWDELMSAIASAFPPAP